jgi:FAD/FMN-containing dehydrogenase
LGASFRKVAIVDTVECQRSIAQAVNVTLQNFGKTVRFQPRQILAPRDNNAVLTCLEQRPGEKIRAIGRLHSWSEAAVTSGIALDLRHLDAITVGQDDHAQPVAIVGAGCTIGRVLERLGKQGYTLPTLGMITAQTVAGAIATATHGSGRSSLSHYVRAITVAAYDAATGAPRLFRWDDGDALRAARCGLGCAGIVLSVEIAVVPRYLIEERTGWFDRIDDALAQEAAFPLQQFYLVPWTWRWFAQARREHALALGEHPGLSARAMRLFRLAGVDVTMNGAVRLLSQTARSNVGVRQYFRHVFPAVARAGLTVVDESHHLLTMRHDLYRYVETEIFVPARHVRQAALFVEWVLRRGGGESPPLPQLLKADMFGDDLNGGLRPSRGLPPGHGRRHDDFDEQRRHRMLVCDQPGHLSARAPGLPHARPRPHESAGHRVWRAAPLGQTLPVDRHRNRAALSRASALSRPLRLS